MGKFRVSVLIVASCMMSSAFASVKADADAVPSMNGTNVPMTLLLRQLILDKYGSEGGDSLTDEQKEQLRKDAREARKKARDEFAKRFDLDGDGKYSPEEYRKFREHTKRPFPRKARPTQDFCPSQGSSSQSSLVEVKTPGKKPFRVAPGLTLLTRNLLIEKYDANKSGRLEPAERELVRNDAHALYNEIWQSLMEAYDVDQDGKLSPVEREQALAASHEDEPLDSETSNEEVDLIDLFIRANMSEVLLKEVFPSSEDE